MTTVVEETVDMTEAGTMTVAEDTRRLDVGSPRGLKQQVFLCD